jgi:predicted DNA-binding protein (UPF0251 family)/predicted Fe-Mo cluster-binding NifX family protein
MPRPRKCRRISGTPKELYFKPQGIPMWELNEVYLPFEGVEALRLADLEGLSQQEAAQRMHVSRHTFGRILAEARTVVSQALVGGMALRIQGGDYIVADRCTGVTRRRTSLHPDVSCPYLTQNPPATTGRENQHMTKIAITSEGPSLDDRMDSRFGRAAGFVVVDLETMQTEYIDNGASQVMAQGAGIQAAETVARSGVNVLLTGFVGPKAFQALNAVGIQVGQGLEDMTVRMAIEKFTSGEVSMAEGPNREAGR